MYEVDQYTVSLLHFDDGIKDETGRVWTAQNGAVISNIQTKFGDSSLYLNGTDQYLTTPNSADLDFGNGDFTIDWWEFRETDSLYNPVLIRTNSKIHSYQVGVCNESGIVVNISSNGIDWDIAKTIPMGKIILNAWTHYALVRQGNTFYTFQNGSLVSSWTSSLSIMKGADTTSLGHYSPYNYTYKGYIDEFRISNIARWTSDFDPNPKVGKALLIVTMSDEIQKEYELSTDEINSFITWYNNRSTGVGLPHYTFNKDFNLGPFQSRKDYLVFDKIQNFEVMEYTK